MSMMARRIGKLVDRLEGIQAAASAAAQREQSRLVMNAVFCDPEAVRACERLAEAQFEHGEHSPEAQQALEQESHILLKYMSAEAIERLEAEAAERESCKRRKRDARP